jgi:hypothetical protein
MIPWAHIQLSGQRCAMRHRLLSAQRDITGTPVNMTSVWCVAQALKGNPPEKAVRLTESISTGEDQQHSLCDLSPRLMGTICFPGVTPKNAQ